VMRRWSVAATIVALVAGSLVLAGNGGAAWAVDRTDEVVSVIVSHEPGTTVPGGRSLASLAPVPAVVLELRRSRVDALAASPGVVDVSPNRRLRVALAETTAQIGAPGVWASGGGAGTAVAVIDTGVDAAHPMLAGKLVAEACFTPGSGGCPNGGSTQVGPGAATPCGAGACGHGTQVAAAAVGDGDGRRGVAPEASLVAVQVFVPDGGGSPVTDEASLVAALEWVYSVRDTHRIAAVNLSLGGSSMPTPCTASPPMTSVVDRLDAAGVAVVVASGNGGSTSQLNFPACMARAVSVGSVSDAGLVSSFSNVAAGLSLLAPGENVTTARAGGGYTTSGGTSYAAPHVSGSYALLRQRLPGWTVAEMTTLLRRTGELAFHPATGSYPNARVVRVDRATQAQYQSRSPASFALPASPIGRLDEARAHPGGIRVLGWSLDPDTVAPVTVHLYVDGAFAGTASARGRRPDVGAAFPGYGDEHGFDTVIAAAGGRRTVCAYGIDLGPGQGNVLLGCTTLTSGWVTGALDLAAPSGPGALRVAGWALDSETDAAIAVHVYVDGAFAASLTASGHRPDVAAAFPSYGPTRGFDAVIAVSSGGVRQVCAYGIEAGVPTGANALLGCRAVALPTGSPFGALDVVTAGLGTVRFAGWAIDPDTTAPIAVHVYVDGLGSASTADRPRSDVGAAFGAYGPNHGFDVTVSAPAGSHRACAYAIDDMGGASTLLGCRVVVVGDGSPFGALDAVSMDGSVASIAGWAIDPETSDPIAVHVYADGVGVATTVAGGWRPDVAAAFPGYGAGHGYALTLVLPPGTRALCAYGINVGLGANVLLGCRTVG
jgi:subtilisin family serine protease